MRWNGRPGAKWSRRGADVVNDEQVNGSSAGTGISPEPPSVGRHSIS